MKTVIEMAREAGLVQESEYFYSPREEEADVHIKDLERFAELVRTDERDACAKVCEPWLGRYPAIEIMNAIRARGQA